MRYRLTFAAGLFSGFLFLTYWIVQAAVDEVPTLEHVGPAEDGGWIMPTGHKVRSAGQTSAFPGRPVDLVLSKDAKMLYVKDNKGIRVIGTEDFKIRQELSFPMKEGASMHGLALSHDGKRLYASTAQRNLHVAAINDEGTLKWKRAIELPGPKGPKKYESSHSLGMALTRNGKVAYVCLSRNNTLGIVDLVAGKLVKQIDTGVAPYDVALSPDEKFAYVSNWGGRKPKAGDKTANSSGTPALIDERGVAASGTVMKIDLENNGGLRETAVGLHPCAIALSADGETLYVANANSDTVSILQTKAFAVKQTLLVRPDPNLPFGSATNALFLSSDGKTLYACNGGNNALAVISLEGKAKVLGFIPTGWYPGAVKSDGKRLFVANIKGEGSRTPKPGKLGWNTHQHRGTVSKIAIPDAAKLREYTAQVRADSRVPQILAALEKKRSGIKPVPVPRRWGESSVFEHVVYIIKENRTYDQVFGDIKESNAEPKLCIYGEKITPNLHALARQFVLLDNYYCNGVLSADGHAWAIEGNASDHFERQFGGFTRSYTFGDDPLAYSSSGFLWDKVLLRGLSFRNYGEYNETKVVPAKATFKEIFDDHRNATGKIKFVDSIGIEALRRYSAAGCPGWNLHIPDQVRVDYFLKEFRAAEKKGEWQNLTIMHLPQDHTSGTKAGMPTPRAHVADNDLAVGRLVEAVSNSKFWPKTCIFIIEDDPQDGWDHVDGHRSVCFVLSPYSRRGKVISQFYNQTSVLHTMERILGVPPMNQIDALAPVMTACFSTKPDLTPYQALPANVKLDELNPPAKKLKGQARIWAEKSVSLDFSKPDAADEDTLNRILWFAAKGKEEYPAAFAGTHGRGLGALKLRLVSK
jgi:DNA-binding beta-propeller fold protein YncE